MAKQPPVIVWTNVDPNEWSKEVFEDLGMRDLVRTRLEWYLGAGPTKTPMHLTGSTTSVANEHGQMTETTVDAAVPSSREVAYDQEPLFLGRQLAGEAKLNTTLYIFKAMP